ncbi:recombinase family protein [Burkholderia sp. BCC1998]|uniref:recombinase family protein n=1 Tax=Burkholderia sp. BCC1998 TaxID=2817447 RepID=UPI002AB78155|nr:recombinase family protein [Burkholderia sp. BCC1998]
MAIFGYGRVSTGQQTTENQRLELERAGFVVDYWFSDHGISGKTCASERPEFGRLLDKIRDGETLVVAKLDRLGRDAVDVLQTIRALERRSIKVIVMQLPAPSISGFSALSFSMSNVMKCSRQCDRIRWATSLAASQSRSRVDA